MKVVKINKYSCYDNYTVKDNGTNLSRITSKMVQLAGRLCENYASDIVYDANAFKTAVEHKLDYDKFLFFREDGVTAKGYDDIILQHSTDFIQVWHLTYDAETQDQEFTRVYISVKEGC